MPQFDVYANPNPGSRVSVPFVVDVQSNLIDALPTRLVMPLSRVGAGQAKLPSNLCPPVTFEGEVLTLMPHLAAPIDKRLLRRPVQSMVHRAHDINAALDAVISGI
jgi:toxin CcdB